MLSINTNINIYEQKGVYGGDLSYFCVKFGQTNLIINAIGNDILF